MHVQWITTDFMSSKPANNVVNQEEYLKNPYSVNENFQSYNTIGVENQPVYIKFTWPLLSFDLDPHSNQFEEILGI